MSEEDELDGDMERLLNSTSYELECVNNSEEIHKGDKSE